MLGLVFLAILLRLGFWQLERAEEKQQLLSRIAHQQALSPLDVDTLARQLSSVKQTPAAEKRGADTFKYRRVTVSGQFDVERYWLLDNQVQQGVVGYHVIGLFVSQQGVAVLVNRGWVPAPPYREQLPPVAFPEGLQTLHGRLVQPADNPLLRSAAPPDADDVQWPLRTQKISIADAERALGQTVLPGLVQLRPDDPAALLMEWRDVNVSVGKHHGYAVQWFTMAAALVVALVFANTNLATMFSASSPAVRRAATDDVSAERTDNKNNTMEAGGR